MNEEALAVMWAIACSPSSASVCAAHTRRYDILVRSGDDEFVLIMPTTSPTQAQATAEKLRKAVGDEPMEPKAGGYSCTSTFRESESRPGTAVRTAKSCAVEPVTECWSRECTGRRRNLQGGARNILRRSDASAVRILSRSALALPRSTEVR